MEAQESRRNQWAQCAQSREGQIHLWVARQHSSLREHSRYLQTPGDSKGEQKEGRAPALPNRPHAHSDNQKLQRFPRDKELVRALRPELARQGEPDHAERSGATVTTPKGTQPADEIRWR